MPPPRPMLDDHELDVVQWVSSGQDAAVVRHPVAGRAGDLLQFLGRHATVIRLAGYVLGPTAKDRLAALEQKFHARQPVRFVADVGTLARVTDVLIESMQVRELAGKPDRFGYAFVLREYIPPPPPPAPPPAPLVETGTGGLVVEVVVAGEPAFDASRIRVTAAQAGAAPRAIEDRSGDRWVLDGLTPGEYRVEARVEGAAMTGAATATVAAGQSAAVRIVLQPDDRLARAFVVHFRFDSAFVEPAMRAVLGRVVAYADAHPAERLVVVGHTDLVGSAAYNQALSERRARSVSAFLVHGRDAAAAEAEWDELRRPRPAGSGPTLHDNWGGREYQHILQDLGYYTGNVDGENGSKTRAGVRRFQQDRGLPETGAVDDATWRALVTAYLSQDAFAVSDERFAAVTAGSAVRARWLGCGEEDPVRATTDAWRPNRRVECLFVRAAELPGLPPPEPVTYNLPAPPVDAWPAPTAAKRNTFAARGAPAADRWLVVPAEEGAVVVRGQLRHDDGTPYANGKFVLTAADGEYLGGERPGGPGGGVGVPGRTDADGRFSYTAPKSPRVFVLEVPGPVVVRLSGQPLDAAKGNSVWKFLTGSPQPAQAQNQFELAALTDGPPDAATPGPVDAAAPAGAPYNAIVTSEALVADRQEVIVRGQNPADPVGKAWVYWRDGGVTTLRTDADGRLTRLRDGGERTGPWDYSARFATSKTTAEVLVTRGAVPLPEPAVAELSGEFATVPVGQAVPATPGLGQIVVPNPVLTLTQPRDLTLWPVLWERPADAFYTTGLNQGAALWDKNGNLTVTEGAAAPLLAAAAAERPLPRGLRVTGEVAAGAAGVRLKLADAAGTFLQVRPSPSAPAATEVAATLQPPTPAGPLPFEGRLFLVDPPAAFGKAHLLAIADGVATKAVVATAFVLLCGAQAEVVDDAKANAAGTAAGPFRREADDEIVIDFLTSPQASPAKNKFVNLSPETRARRMVKYQIRTRERPLDPAAPVGPTNPTIVKPEMPLLMGELQFVGADRAGLTDLLVRRQHALPNNPTDLTVGFDWVLNLAWDGPDKAVAGGYGYSKDFSGAVSAKLTVGANKQLDGIDPQGKVTNALQPPPTAVPFPVAGRRLPAVAVDRPRPWGRVAGAPTRNSLVIEWQPRIAAANGRELIRGGDGRVSINALTVGGAAVDPGFVRVGGAVVAAPADDLAPPPVCRVEGVNFTNAQRQALVEAVVDEYLRANQGSAVVQMLSAACWRATMLRIVVHEAGRQFDTRASARIRYGPLALAYGREKGLPIFGPPRGYGLGQLDPPGTDDRVWSFLDNLRRAFQLLVEDKGQGALNMLNPHPVANAHRRRAIFQREMVRRYNGGREFAFEGGDWVIRPAQVGGQLATAGHPEHGANPRLLYPNQVLERHVEYFTCPTPDPADGGLCKTKVGHPPNHPDFNWPIAFTDTALFGPLTNQVP